MKKKGFTLVEVLVGVFLLTLIFLGVFGAYRLIAKVIQRSERKITASAIANQQMERIRNLPYLKVGTKNAELPYAQGILTQSTTTERNGISYDLRTKVKLISDSADGLDESECDWDYKRAQVTVSWAPEQQVRLVTDVAPADQAEEIAVCQEQPGGILSVSAFDAQGVLVSSPLIEVFEAETGSLVDSYQPSDGQHDFPLATSTYKVVVSKEQFSTSSTYGSNEVTHPEKNNPVILEGEITGLGFAIDEVSTLGVETLSTWSVETWSDTFEDESKISELNGLVVKNGQVQPTASTGYLYSVGVSPNQLVKWDELSWSDSETTGDLSYQLYYATSTDWYLISDAALSGNTEGFDTSPVDISGLDVNQYPKLKIKGNASTTFNSVVLESWQLSWKTSGGTLIGNTAFHLRGDKTIGTDANDEPVYKYSATTSSDGSGQVKLDPVEWDSYTFRSAESDLDLVTSTPSQPVNVAPGSTTTVDLYFESQNSLLLTVKNKESLDPILGASTTLSNVQYNETQYTDDQGQTHFIPLDEANYDLKISASGYQSTSTSITVSGDESEIIKLKQVE